MKEHTFTTFNIGEGTFAINVLLVREIIRDCSITKVDPMPDFIAGLINLRGQVVAVIDASVRLGLPSHGCTRESRCIVLKTAAELDMVRTEGFSPRLKLRDITGLMVDRIGDMITVNEDQIKSPPSSKSDGNIKYLDNVIMLDKKLIAILKLEELLKWSKLEAPKYAANGSSRDDSSGAAEI